MKHFLSHKFPHRELSTLLVRSDIGKHLLVQGRRREGEEIHAAARFSQVARHRTRIHVATTHIRAVQLRGTKHLQSEFEEVNETFVSP